MPDSPKLPVLMRFYAVIESSGIPNELGQFDYEEALTKISDSIAELLEPIEFPFGLYSASSIGLDPNTINCGRCSECGVWVTDMEQPTPLAGLHQGARVNGNLLCDDDLPKDHRWAF